MLFLNALLRVNGYQNVLFLGSIEECSDCRQCLFSGTCYIYGQGPPNPEACKSKGGIDCSGSYVFILRSSILKMFQVSIVLELWK